MLGVVVGPSLFTCCCDVVLLGTPCPAFLPLARLPNRRRYRARLPLGRDARSLARVCVAESELGTLVRCHAWCCVPVNEAGHVSDDPRSLTGNDTKRQQTLVVPAHVNEPLRWRCKTVGGRQRSSNGRLWAFVRQLAKAKSRSVPRILVGRARQAWQHRWSSMLACASARAFALSLLDRRPVSGSDGATPSSAEVLADCRHLHVVRAHQF